MTIFTPHAIPPDGSNLITKSVFLNLFRNKNEPGAVPEVNQPVQDGDNDKQERKSLKSSEKSPENMLDLFKNINIWLLLLASCAWELRRNTHQARYSQPEPITDRWKI